jgi:hypothetical protein
VLSVIETTEPLDASQGSIHHLCALAGTIGLPGLSDLPSHAQTPPAGSSPRPAKTSPPPVALLVTTENTEVTE